MNKWCGLLPVALCAGGFGLPAHALHVVDTAPQWRAISTLVPAPCPDNWVPLPANPFGDPACSAAEPPDATDPWQHTAFPPNVALPAERPVAAEPTDPARMLAQTRLHGGEAAPSPASRAAQMLAGLATVVVVVRRRLSVRTV